jgi:hypothetical protein
VYALICIENYDFGELPTVKKYGLLLLDTRHKQMLDYHAVISIALVGETGVFRHVNEPRIVHRQISDRKAVHPLLF